MGSINRATLPQNFLDSVSRGMRLPQPEPEYLFAKMAMAGRLSLAAIDAGARTVQQFVTEAAGGAPVSPQLDQLARVGDAYPDAVTAVDDFGLGMGDNIKLRRPIFEGGGYDEESRRVSPDKATSTVGQSIKAEEVPVILSEFEGPYNTALGAPSPYAIRDFDAKYKANRDQLAGLTTLHLQRDYVKWLDAVVRNRFRATSNITYADGVANVAAFTAGAGHIASLELFAKARKKLSDREWGKFPNGRYVCLVPTQFNVDMIGDPDYRQLSAFHTERNPLFGYITSYQDVDFFECTTLKTYVAADGAVPGDGQTTPANVTTQEALLFGPGAVGMGTAMTPSAFWADDTDFGKVAKVLWRSLQAFQTLDNRAVERVLFQTG
jgi:hypothetical protein